MFVFVVCQLVICLFYVVLFLFLCFCANLTKRPGLQESHSLQTGSFPKGTGAAIQFMLFITAFSKRYPLPARTSFSYFIASANHSFSDVPHCTQYSSHTSPNGIIFIIS